MVVIVNVLYIAVYNGMVVIVNMLYIALCIRVWV